MTRRSRRRIPFPAVRTALAALLCAGAAWTASHREAPLISQDPMADNTDVYAFRSTEPGREDFVTIIANYVPLQEPAGGPNYYRFDSDVRYEIHIENDGDLDEPDDLTFQFQFKSNLSADSLSLEIGGRRISPPIRFVTPITSREDGGPDEYAIDVVRNGGQPETATNRENGEGVFLTPFSRTGNKTFPDYPSYAEQFIYDVVIPGCEDGRVFAGPRQEPFFLDLRVFDLFNIDDIAGPRDAGSSSFSGFNVNSIALEVPIDCLTRSESDPVIGIWAGASRRRSRSLADGGDPAAVGDFVQVSRLGMPLVNEVLIGLPEKNRYNFSHPRDDDTFNNYIANPTLPELIEILFGGEGIRAPNNFPRQDLVAAFVAGIPNLNQDGSHGDLLRLNTSIPPTPPGQQNDLGVIGDDLAGFPNGRRLGDDVVDITLRALMGRLQHSPELFGDTGGGRNLSVSGAIGGCSGALDSSGNVIQILNCTTNDFPGIFRAQIFRLGNGQNVANDIGPIFFQNVTVPTECRGPNFPNCLGVRYFNNQNPNGALVGPIVRQGGTNPFDPTQDAPSGLDPFTDGVRNDVSFRDTFPYLTDPIPGAGPGSH